MGVDFILNYSHIFLDMQKPQSFGKSYADACFTSEKKNYILKVRTCIEILPWNGSHMKGAQIGNFSLTGS